MCISAAHKSNSHSLNNSFCRTVVSRIWGNISCLGFPLVVYKSSTFLSVLFALNCHLSSGLSPNCSIYVSQRNKDKRWKWWKGISRRPCHWQFAHTGAKPRRPVTPFGSRRADSSHSSLSSEGLFCRNYCRCSLLVASSAWVCILTWWIQSDAFQSRSQQSYAFPSLSGKCYDDFNAS